MITRLHVVAGSGYVNLLTTRGVGRVVITQVIARFPVGMLSLAFLLHIQQETHSYAAAGIVLAAASVGQAIAGPMTSRLMGVWGIRPVVALTLIVCAIAVLTIALAPLNIFSYVVVGFISGVSAPPIQPAVRTIYPTMVNSHQLTSLFSLDSSAQEIIWISGPLLAIFLATEFGTAWGISVAVILLVVGGTWFVLSPEVGKVRIPPSQQSFGRVVRQPPVLIVTITGFLLVSACASFEAGIVALFSHSEGEAGILLAIFSLGSLIAGLVTGSFSITSFSLTRRMLAVLVGFTLAVFFPTFWWLLFTLFIAGLGAAPALTVLFSVISGTVKFRDTAEAYGWVGTGQLAGAALGSATAGVLIDQLGGLGAAWSAILFAFLGVCIPFVFAKHLPDLRHHSHVAEGGHTQDLSVSSPHDSDGPP